MNAVKRMKAITIWQPWTSLLVCGAKQYETRGWATTYRGSIALHAAMKDPCKLPLLDKKDLERIVQEEIDAGRCPPWCFMPTGKIIATAELVNVWHIVHNPGLDMNGAKHIDICAKRMPEDKHAPDFGDYFIPTEEEMALGDWTPGRFAWELKNVKPMDPIPAKGQQGLWWWEMPTQEQILVI